MKDNYIIGALIALFSIGPICLFVMDKNTPDYEFLNAPKITVEDSLKETTVRKISFERNGLFINNVRYNAGTISWYSIVHFDDTICKLEEIQPPFKMKKKKHNDTLEIIKKEKKYFILLTDEKS